MFDTLIHADWSMSAGKRWAAAAERQAGQWVVQAPALVGPSEAFLKSAFVAAEQQRVLIGFDFPIGIPAAYGKQTGLMSFLELLPAIGEGAWSQFCAVAAQPEDIAITRPFYPLSYPKGVSRGELVKGLGMATFSDLLRLCERRTEHRQAACSLFWTLGGNQVGKGALSGWKEIIRPALLRGAALWPFDGSLSALADRPGVVLAETCPAEAYRMVGAGFRSGESKRRKADRHNKAGAIVAWAERHGVVLTQSASNALVDGFGSSASGEDQFDAMLGLLKMIEVNEGRQKEMTERHEATAVWEGWILGR